MKIGICGFGTVGGGTLALLQSNGDEISRRLGRNIQVSRIASRSIKISDFDESGIQVATDPFELISDSEVDIVIETLGGFDPAFEVVRQALLNGKHVVTANKALIAERGNELFSVAQDNGVTLSYESSVAGGIPIIKALREGLAANKINWLAGIINGTGNFILTEMADKQRQFDDVLQQAQELGYAEADPTFDVEGIDAAHKLTIMASIAFGIPLQFDKTYTEGISHIKPEDINYAAELGYRIKHLGIARLSDKGVEMRVHPTLISRKQLLANVDGVGNAVMVHGNAVGSTLYSGPGAGAAATASAVVADIIDIARAMEQGITTPIVPALGYRTIHQDLKVVDIEDIESEYYLRIPAKDVVGVMAKISNILQECGISIEAVIQKEVSSDSVPIVILTHRAVEKQMNSAISAIEQLQDIVGTITRIRVETLTENSEA
ncbi:MAG: homoserine dehydrogenase [SAR86 cluster bacterium]|uniref:Homoserine dehydrogenase n=1 Tax=SAR86 cluster bacterium TaxID=2030880 RepID=A0A2A5AXS3_9GAMM|nr:MAG: homoserine dehydrogenase [SAR86 cluster bacterium]